MFLALNTTRYYQTRKPINLIEMNDMAQEKGFVRFNIVSTYYCDKVVAQTHAIFRLEKADAVGHIEDLMNSFYSNGLTEYYGVI